MAAERTCSATSSSACRESRCEAFAREVLFAPLGISDWEMKYRNQKIAAAAGLRLRPRTLQKSVNSC